MNTNNTPSWEEEFDEKFTWGYEGEYFEKIKDGTKPEAIKAFIRTHFIPREKIREVVAGMGAKCEKVHTHPRKCGAGKYNKALTDVLQALLDETK